MKKTVILVSPAPVDGYPPVQYQAKLLADAGFAVELLTEPLRHARTVTFRYPGVRVTQLPRVFGASGAGRRLGNSLQFARYVLALSLLRLKVGVVAVEIAFDPNGIMMSDWALFRPRRRIAHFHETVKGLGNRHMATRLPRALLSYGRVVVADAGRAKLLQSEMELPHLPVVTPNYPLKEAAVAKAPGRGPRFEVIYGGSLADDQMIPLIIRSVPLWPQDTVLVLVGDDKRPAAQPSKALAAEMGLGERVIFAGWMSLEDLLARYRQASLGISLLDPHIDQWVLSVGASNKRYQYMQAGLAQIGDRIAGVPELLEGNGIGRCVTEYCTRAIADLVRYYVEHPAERLEAGRRAERLHDERYNYQAAFEPTLHWIQNGDSA